MVKLLVDDPSPAVRREAVLALHHNSKAEAAGLWATYAEKYDGKDRWYLEALGIAADGAWDADFAAWMKLVNSNWNTPKGRDIVWRSRTAAALPMLAAIIADPANDPSSVLKFFRAFDFHPEPEKQKVLLSLLQAKHPSQARMDAYVLLLIDPTKAPVTTIFKQAVDSALQCPKGTADYIVLVNRLHLKDKGPELLALAEQGNDEEIRSSALQLLLNTGGNYIVAAALKKHNETSLTLINTQGLVEEKKNKELLQSVILERSAPTPLRIAAVKSMGEDWTGEDGLLSLIKNKKLPADLLDTTVLILAHSNRQTIRAEAGKYGNISSVAKSNAIEPIDKLIKLSGNGPNGNKVFITYCSSCHRINNAGVNFGPDLSEIGTKLSKEALYTAILKPSAGISFGYEGYIFKLKNGSQLIGYIASQTETEITIKMPGGQSETYKKAEIVSKTDYGKSLMTEELPEAMGQQNFLDLVEYLSSLKTGGAK